MRLPTRSIALTICFAILNLGSPLVAQAGVIGTLEVLDSHSRSADLATVNAALARKEVREQFLSLGVDPAQVESRIAALTEPELRNLARQIENAPAGGSALAVIGIVFLVLLILEAVGVIDIFKKFP